MERLLALLKRTEHIGFGKLLAIPSCRQEQNWDIKRTGVANLSNDALLT